ncbi:catalase [Micropruina sonneratiae]|uniref:catalase n=1 Tax=Micropruina sonneratiae TaxID=2986940 RepID=UPI0029D40E1F|nr:catalase [Micropruina sp. KQZ13P-5]
MTANDTDLTNGAPGVQKAPHQRGDRLTTSTGTRLSDTDHSLKAGPRGPILLADHHLREKITHFDHERIPERVVHARGAAAHGTFVANGAAEGICRADFLRRATRTPVFARFSTVLGSRGSADTARDTRGFAVKFYTQEGNYDLVGNNIPVFFIQDGIKFPDIIHAGKPHPDREIPQAQSAHDTFWDFVSLHTEAQHHTIWNMSDRGIPRSLRMMEGFGVHTWRLTNDNGETTLVKFHWKPRLGVHGLTWEEAQLLGGADPDFHRRDLADAIDAGDFPEWDLGVQVMPDTPEEMFEGIDLLDPTKLIPEELAPVRIIGTLTLNANPTNYFAETEQVAFHVGQLVPGIDVTNDPLLQVRLFSYVDTQLTRLGGPNYNQLPINRPAAPVDDLLRDGMHQHDVHRGVAPYLPNSLGGGCPFTVAQDAFIDVPQKLPASRRVRENPASFADHHSQAGLFFRSLSPVERDHVIGAYTFELAHVFEQEIRERQLQQLALIDTGLCAAVAAGLGLPAPASESVESQPTSSPALSMVGRRFPAAGRKVGVLVGSDPAPQLPGLLATLRGAGLTPLLIAPAGGTVEGEVVERSYATAVGPELDAVLVASATPPAPDALPSLDAKADGLRSEVDPRVRTLLEQAWRHAKPIGALTDAEPVLSAAGLDAAAAGMLAGTAPQLAGGLVDLLEAHRVWERFATVSQ